MLLLIVYQFILQTVALGKVVSFIDLRKQGFSSRGVDKLLRFLITASSF